MPFLIRFVSGWADGEVEVDETIVAETEVLHGFGKGFQMLGREGKIRVTFDPPLVPADAA